MSRILQAETTRRCMGLLLYFHLTAIPTFGQQPPFDEAMIKWREYEDFSHRLQGAGKYQATDLVSGKEFGHSFFCKQNRHCSMFRSSFGRKGVEFCMMSNPRYTAEVKLKPADAKGVLLRAYSPDQNTNLPSAPVPISDYVFDQFSPHYSYCNSKLSELISKTSFHIEKVSRETIDGCELVRVDHTYSYYVPPVSEQIKRQTRVKGSIYFDPSHCWCVRRVKRSEQSFINSERNIDTEFDSQYQTIDHSSGFPIIKNQTFHTIQTVHAAYKTKDGQPTQRRHEAKYRIDYELEVNDRVPDDEFTLSAFGLPEPGGEVVKKPIPIYIWLLVVAGLCAMLALGFRYLAHRKRSPASS